MACVLGKRVVREGREGRTGYACVDITVCVVLWNCTYLPDQFR